MLTTRLIKRALTGLTAAVALSGGVLGAAAPAQASTGHGVLASLPGVVSVANYQDRTGLHVVHAATWFGEIHEYTWRDGGSTNHGLLATLPGVLDVANYQDRTGLHVLHAAANDGKIHEYTWT